MLVDSRFLCNFKVYFLVLDDSTDERIPWCGSDDEPGYGYLVDTTNSRQKMCMYALLNLFKG